MNSQYADTAMTPRTRTVPSQPGRVNQAGSVIAQEPTSAHLAVQPGTPVQSQEVL